MNNITVGKFYKTRDGHKVRIYATDGSPQYPIHGAYLNHDNHWTQTACTLTGEYFCNCNYGSPLAIVSEWSDKPEFDWSKHSPWLKYAAQDKNGLWFLYSDRPEKSCASWWLITQGGALLIPAEYTPKFSGSWEDSLISRSTL